MHAGLIWDHGSLRTKMWKSLSLLRSHDPFKFWQWIMSTNEIIECKFGMLIESVSSKLTAPADARSFAIVGVLVLFLTTVWWHVSNPSVVIVNTTFCWRLSLCTTQAWTRDIKLQFYTMRCSSDISSILIMLTLLSSFRLLLFKCNCFVRLKMIEWMNEWVKRRRMTIKILRHVASPPTVNIASERAACNPAVTRRIYVIYTSVNLFQLTAN